MHRDERAAEVGAWLTKASDDLRAAALDLRTSPPLLSDASFHCQQAAEKAMKGLFVYDGVAFGKTHDLRALGDRLVKLHPELESLVDEVAPFTEYAWRFRYPGELFEPPAEEVRDAIEVAGRFVASVRVIAEDASA